jgi:hypothetical protein
MLRDYSFKFVCEGAPELETLNVFEVSELAFLRSIELDEKMSGAHIENPLMGPWVLVSTTDLMLILE